jgi:TerB-C domain
MAGILAVCIFIFILLLSGKKKPKSSGQPLPRRTPSRTAAKPASSSAVSSQAAAAPPPPQAIRTAPNPSYKAAEHGIIDITGPPEKINAPDEKSQSGTPREVITWPHRYIYSYNDFSNATRDQRSFYFYFRDCFLKGRPVDLKGNNNYAFILLFDFLREYDTHRDTGRLQNELTALGHVYPISAVYAKNELVRRLQEKTRVTPDDKYPHTLDQPPVQQPVQPAYEPAVYAPAYPLLGAKFKGKIPMTDEQEKMLNNLYYGTNIFFSNTFCQEAIVGLFVRLLPHLKEYFATRQTTFDDTLTAIADLIARKHFHYRSGSDNYKYCISSSRAEFRILLMKQCENAVREQYGFKRRLSLQSSYSHADIQTALDIGLINPAAQLLPGLAQDCPKPDEQTDIYLNTQNTTRWKAQLDKVKDAYKVQKDADVFLRNVLHLARRNKQNPSIEHIFFEASKFIGKDNKTICLSLYVHYIYYDQRSEKVDDKPLNKTLLKSLSLKIEQQNTFEALLGQLKTDKDLPKALKATAGLFEVKRKKLRLDESLIGEAETAYTDTVVLLNEYLVDDQEIEPSPLTAVPEAPAPAQTIPTPLVPVVPESDAGNEKRPASLQLKPVQQALLDLFVRHNLLLGATDLEEFAKEKGVFRNQLIDSINEACYEILDDVLIEEEDDSYLIQQHYYQRVLQP